MLDQKGKPILLDNKGNPMVCNCHPSKLDSYVVYKKMNKDFHRKRYCKLVINF